MQGRCKLMDLQSVAFISRQTELFITTFIVCCVKVSIRILARRSSLFLVVNRTKKALKYMTTHDRSKLLSLFCLAGKKFAHIFLRGINQGKTKKCKSHLRASILVSPKMHKSFCNYSYTRSRKEEATRTCSEEQHKAENGKA